MPSHVFIAHAVEDKRIADLVCQALERRGIQCWYAPRDVPCGMSFEEAIVDAICASTVMILILTGHSNDSSHVKREIQNACMEDAQIPILPFRVENIKLNKALRYYLASTQWLDASTPPLENHLENLVKRVRAYLPLESQRKIDEDQPLIGIKTEHTDRAMEVTPVAGPEQSIKKSNQRRWYIVGGATVALVVIILAVVTNRSNQNDSSQAQATAPAESNSPSNNRPSGDSQVSDSTNTNQPVNSESATNKAADRASTVPSRHTRKPSTKPSPSPSATIQTSSSKPSPSTTRRIPPIITVQPSPSPTATPRVLVPFVTLKPSPSPTATPRRVLVPWVPLKPSPSPSPTATPRRPVPPKP